MVTVITMKLLMLVSHDCFAPVSAVKDGCSLLACCSKQLLVLIPRIAGEVCGVVWLSSTATLNFGSRHYIED